MQFDKAHKVLCVRESYREIAALRDMQRRVYLMGRIMSWIFMALLGAFFTAVTGTLAKAGLEKVDSNLGLAIQSTVVLICVWTVVAIQGKASDLTQIAPRAWGLLLLSGVATTIGYLCYFAALKAGDSSRVQPIDRLSLVFAIVLAAFFLREKVGDQVIIGAVLMTIGAVVIAAAGSK